MKCFDTWIQPEIAVVKWSLRNSRIFIKSEEEAKMEKTTGNNKLENPGFDVALFRETVAKNGGNRIFSEHFEMSPNWSTKLGLGYGHLKDFYARRIYDDYGVDVSLDKRYEGSKRRPAGATIFDEYYLNEKPKRTKVCKSNRVKIDKDKLQEAIKIAGGERAMSEAMGRNSGYIHEVVRRYDNISRSDYILITSLYDVDIEYHEPEPAPEPAPELVQNDENEPLLPEDGNLYSTIYSAVYNAVRHAIRDIKNKD